MNIQLESEQVHLLWLNYLRAILDPLAMDEAMEKAMLNCGLNVCDNDSMSMFKDLPKCDPRPLGYLVVTHSSHSSYMLL